jgi:hypothetical protein
VPNMNNNRRSNGIIRDPRPNGIIRLP